MEKLKKILEEISPFVDYENVDNLIEEADFDSLSIITLLQKIEEEYDISIPPEYINKNHLKNMHTIQDMIDTLLQK